MLLDEILAVTYGAGLPTAAIEARFADALQDASHAFVAEYDTASSGFAESLLSREETLELVTTSERGEAFRVEKLEFAFGLSNERLLIREAVSQLKVHTFPGAKLLHARSAQASAIPDAATDRKPAPVYTGPAQHRQNVVGEFVNGITADGR